MTDRLHRQPMFKLGDTCPHCDAYISPAEIRRVAMGRCVCPFCKAEYGEERPLAPATAVPVPSSSSNSKHRVYMRYERKVDVWHVSFTLQTGSRPLRTFTFTTADKVEQLADRAGALRTLADRQALESGIRAGRGGIQLLLDNAQLDRLLL